MSKKSIIFWSDVAAILPGIGLLLGWILYPLYLYLTPLKEVKVKVKEAVINKVEFVRIPQDEVFHSYQHAGGDPKKYRIVYEKMPVLDINGNPMLRISEKTYSGKGTPKITGSEVIEVMIPILKNPHWTYEDIEIPKIKVLDPEPKFPLISKPGMLVRKYKPNIEYLHTGVFFEKKNVQFYTNFSKESFSIFSAMLASILSLLIFVYKYWQCKNHDGSNSQMP